MWNNNYWWCAEEGPALCGWSWLFWSCSLIQGWCDFDHLGFTHRRHAHSGGWCDVWRVISAGCFWTNDETMTEWVPRAGADWASEGFLFVAVILAEITKDGHYELFFFFFAVWLLEYIQISFRIYEGCVFINFILFLFKFWLS